MSFFRYFVVFILSLKTNEKKNMYKFNALEFLRRHFVAIKTNPEYK